MHFEKMEDYTRDNFACGLHMYCIIWEVTVGEVCDWELEPGQQAVAVKKDTTAIRHLLTNLAAVKPCRVVKCLQ